MKKKRNKKINSCLTHCIQGKKTMDKISCQLKTSQPYLLQVFSNNLANVFLMSLRSMEQVILERPLNICSLDNDPLALFPVISLKNFLSHVSSSVIFLLALWILCLFLLIISCLLHINRKMKLKNGNTQIEFKYLLFCANRWMTCLKWRIYRFTDTRNGKIVWKQGLFS